MLLHFLQHHSHHLHSERSSSQQHLHIDKASISYTIVLESRHTCFPELVTMCQYIWAFYTECNHHCPKIKPCGNAKLEYSDTMRRNFWNPTTCPHWTGKVPPRYPEPEGAMYGRLIPVETLQMKMNRLGCTEVETDVICDGCWRRLQSS